MYGKSDEFLLSHLFESSMNVRLLFSPDCGEKQEEMHVRHGMMGYQHNDTLSASTGRPHRPIAPKHTNLAGITTGAWRSLFLTTFN